MPVIGAKAKNETLLITVRAFSEIPVTAQDLKDLANEVKLITSSIENNGIIEATSFVNDELNTSMFGRYGTTWYSVEVLQADGIFYQITSVRINDEDNL